MRAVSGGGKPLVSILTPSIPERAGMLRECERSVEAQTCRDWEHLVQVDEKREGCATTMNRLALQAQGEWLLPLADDDLLLPGCVSLMLSHSSEGDVIYSPPLVTGNEDRWWFYQSPPVIPSFALIRACLWHDLGGYDDTLTREEDRDLWIRALDAEAVFGRVDEPTWVYRLHGSNKSFAQAAA